MTRIDVEDHHFDYPVLVQTSASRIRVVSSTREAAECLLYGWPAVGLNRKHLEARRACLAVLEGQKKALTARRAFAAAAKEAGILIEHAGN